MSKPHRLLRGIIAFPGFSLVLATAAAQSVPSTPPAAPADPRTAEQTLKLSPFEVKTDKDTGYLAADTLNAGRLSTNLLKTPGDISVLTRDLINDLGIFNIDQAAGWMTNSRPLELGAAEGNSLNPGSIGGADTGTNVSYRGLGAQPSTRNYFLSSVTPKEFNVERIESARGPNAILYGEGGPGGQTNYITKQAKDQNFVVVKERIDTEKSNDVQLDVNRAVTKNFDLRYNGDIQNKNYYISRDQTRTVSNALDLIYRPFDRTTVNFATEYDVNQRPILALGYNDNYSLWNKVPVTGALTAAQATAAGLTLQTTTKRTFIDGLGLIDLKGTAYTQGVALPLVTEYNQNIPNVQAPPPREFNANPQNNLLEEHSGDFQLTVDHSWDSGLSFQLGAQYSKYRVKGGNYAFVGDYIDPNVNLPSGAPNPEFGKMYTNSYLGHVVDGTERDNSTLRAVVDYPVKIDWLGTTNFSAFLQHQQANARTIFSDYHDPSQGSVLDATTEIYIQRYWDNLPNTVPDFVNTNHLVKVPTADGLTRNRTDAYEVALSGDYFNDTLSIVGGFRRDRSNLYSANGNVASRSTTTGQFGSYTIDNRTGFNNTVTVGAVYFPEKYVGLYVNHAEGFQVATISNPELNGVYAHANIVPASDESVGLRFNVAPNSLITIEGSLGWYYVKSKDSPFGIGVASINQIWANHNLTSKYIATFDPNPLDTSATANAITDFRSTVGWGWEAEMVANVGQNVRFYINGALPNTKQSDVGSQYVAYVNANLPTWQAYANDPANALRASDAANIAQINQAITGFQNGRSQNLTYDYRFNALGVYTFTDTKLKGLRLGGGLQYFGPSLIGNGIGLPYDYVFYKSYGVAMFNAGYPVKLRWGAVDFQINVSNAFNYDKPIYNGLFIYQTTRNIPYGFKYNYPRVATFQATYSF